MPDPPSLDRHEIMQRQRLIQRRQPMKPVRAQRPKRQPQIDLRIRTNARSHRIRFYLRGLSQYEQIGSIGANRC